MSRKLYKKDYTLWLADQAATMRRLAAEGAPIPLDLALLAEESDATAIDLRASCGAHTAIIIHYLLKLQFYPSEEQRRGWENTVRTARHDVANRITTTIAGELKDQLEQRFSVASKMAQNDLEQHEREAAGRLPTHCPYTLGEILDPDWWPARALVTP